MLKILLAGGDQVALTTSRLSIETILTTTSSDSHSP